MYKPKQCIKCNKQFFPNSPKQEYCKSCLTYICKNCGSSFMVKDPQRMPEFCNQKCYFENRWGKDRKINKTCPNCKREFISYLAHNKKFCSRKCYTKWRYIYPMPSPGWKGGKIRYGSNNKYWAIYQPYHPFANNKGYVFEHRLVMEKHLKRFLKSCEVIHHINFKSTDNRLENLELLLKREHDRLHTTIRHKTQPLFNSGESPCKILLM